MNRYYSKQAGEEDALSSFGLKNGTPRPPPTWAQEWLEGTRKTGTKNLTIPSMREKKAFLGSALAGLGLHLGANVGQKILRHTDVGKRLEQSQFSSGLAHALSGQKLHPTTENVMRFGLGPESLSHYDAGHLAGKQVAHLSPDLRDAALRQLGSSIGESSHMVGAPVVRSMPGGIDRFLKGQKGFMEKHLTAVPVGQESSLSQKLVAPALGAATVAAAPHVGIQLGVNAGRHLLAKHFGPRWGAKELAKGARGETISPLRRAATDYILSPAANDPRDIGLAANKEYQGMHSRVNQWAAEHGHGPVPLPGAEQIADFGEGVYNRLKKKPTPAAQPQQQPENNGALSRLMLGGAGLYALNRASASDEDAGR